MDLNRIEENAAEILRGREGGSAKVTDAVDSERAFVLSLVRCYPELMERHILGKEEYFVAEMEMPGRNLENGKGPTQRDFVLFRQNGIYEVLVTKVTGMEGLRGIDMRSLFKELDRIKNEGRQQWGLVPINKNAHFPQGLRQVVVRRYDPAKVTDYQWIKANFEERAKELSGNGGSGV